MDDQGVKALDSFIPIKLFRNRHFQSLAASLKFRLPVVRRTAASMLSCAREIIVDCGDNVRLQGYRSFHQDAPRNLVILLHGWEGSSQSLYLLSSAGTLFNNGFDVFRLNLRDHGTSHHLNRGLFHSCRLDELVAAVKRIRNLYNRAEKISLCGFSLGGNFALRVAARAPEAGLRLDKVIAVCPVLNPASTMVALESGPFFYRRYFIYKWKRSLMKKQQLFPGDYHFNGALQFKSLTRMTEYFVENYTDFPDLDTYLRGYDITGPLLDNLSISSSIIASEDDPVIPSHDLSLLATSGNLSIITTRYGGHCGFIGDLRLNSWADRTLVKLLRICP